jgi:hypothetical protein
MTEATNPNEAYAGRLVAAVMQEGLTDDQRRGLLVAELDRLVAAERWRAEQIVRKSLERINLGWKAQSIAKEIRAAAGP